MTRTEIADRMKRAIVEIADIARASGGYPGTLKRDARKAIAERIWHAFMEYSPKDFDRACDAVFIVMGEVSA